MVPSLQIVASGRTGTCAAAAGASRTPRNRGALHWSARLDMSLDAACRPGKCPSMVGTTGHVPRCSGRSGTCPSLVVAVGHTGIMSSRHCRGWAYPADKPVEEAGMNEQGWAGPLAIQRGARPQGSDQAAATLAAAHERLDASPDVVRAVRGWELDMSLVAVCQPGTCPSLVVAVGHSGIMSSPRCRSWTCPADQQEEQAGMNGQGRTPGVGPDPC